MLITNSDDLLNHCLEFSKSDFITVDTEFIRENTYWPKLCLIQIADKKNAVAIDPLNPNLDMNPLWKLFTNLEIVKVFHSCSQDMAILYQTMGSVPGPIFDTQIAAMFCGLGTQPSYASLVSALMGITVDKAPQMTDWSRRPLTSNQLKYALNDVIYLVHIYESLLRILKNNGRQEWVSGEFTELESVDSYEIDHMEQWRRINVKQLSPKSLEALRQIAAWREKRAQKKNLPRNWILKDKPLVEIASKLPKTIAQLETISGLPNKFIIGQNGKSIIKLIKNTISSTADDPSDLGLFRTIRENDKQKYLVASLQALLKIRSEKYHISASVIANRRDIESIVFHDCAQVPALRGWRRCVFGEDALRLKDGVISIKGNGENAIIVNNQKQL